MLPGYGNKKESDTLFSLMSAPSGLADAFMLYNLALSNSTKTGIDMYNLKLQVEDANGNAKLKLVDKDCIQLIGKTASDLRAKHRRITPQLPKEIQSLVGLAMLFMVEVKREQLENRYAPFSVTKTILTLWETLAINQGLQLELQLRQGKFPIILAEGLNVNAFQGLLLGTRYNTSIEVDPVGHRAKVFNEWKEKNSKLIHKAIVDKIYLNSLLTLADPIGQLKTCILALEIEFEQKPIAWVRGKFILLKSDGFDYYVGCNYCNKGIHSMEGLQLHCLFYGQIDGITLRRYRNLYPRCFLNT
nr:replication factor A protein 1-like [Ipomoea batatas]